MNQVRSRSSWLLIWAVLAILYVFTGRLCIAASALVANVSWLPFVPSALSLIASLYFGRNVWPGVFLGEFAIGLVTGEPLLATTIMSTGNALDAALAGWWFHDRLGRRIEFDRLKDVVQLLVSETLILQPLSAAMGMIGLASAGQLAAGQLWSTASAWYSANIFAQFVAAPAAIVWLRWRRPAETAAQYRELALLTALTLVVGALGAGRWATHSLPLPVTLIFILPLLVWASVRFVPSVAVSVGALLGLFAFDAVMAGAGPFRGVERGEQMVYLNVFMGVCLGSALFLAAAMAQQRNAEAEQARLIAELRAASSQVKRLEEFVTFCAWTGRVRWNGEWVSVEKFLHDRYNLSISHGISEEAMSAFLKTVGRTPEEGEGPPPTDPGAVS